MMFDLVAGLPLHPLVVHATEVIVPSAALVVGLAVVAAVLLWWGWDEREAMSPRAPKWVALALTVAAVLFAAGTVVEAVRIGHSGATATWSHVAGSTTLSPSGGSESD